MKKFSDLVPFLLIVIIIAFAVQSFLLFKLMRERPYKHNANYQKQTTCTTSTVKPTKKQQTVQPISTSSQTNPSSGAYSSTPIDDPTVWNPFVEMQRMQQQMDNIFHHSFNRFNRSPFFQNYDKTGFAFSPEIEIKETDDSYIAKLDIPGMEKSTIDVKIEHGILTVSGTRKQEKEEEDKDGKMFRQEIMYGHFSKSVTMPGPVDNDGLEASYENGVLTVILPKKTKETQSKIITVQ